MSIYIHIPFCKTICSYCDFCKMHYHKEWVIKYLDALKKEINSKYNGEEVNTIYIGGGTPNVLNIDELTILFDIIKVFKKGSNLEMTFECNIENIDAEKLIFLKECGVNRLSIGIQTFNEKFLTYLNRGHTKASAIKMVNLAKEIGFDNINVDLIYAITDETMDDLKEDINTYLDLGINHISTYSLIIEPNTKLYIDHVTNIDEDLDYEMYKYIKKTLEASGYIHYETSNFAKPGYESKHNLVYWNNEEYYGFGLGASGYLNDIRYENTRSLNKYLDGDYLLTSEPCSKETKMMYEMILGLRKIEGVNKDSFKTKHQLDIYRAFDIKRLIDEKKLYDDGSNIYITEDYLYLANLVLVNFIK